MDSEIRPYTPSYWYLAIAAPTAAAGAFFVGWFLLSGEKGDLLVGGFGLFISVIVGGALLVAITESRSTHWILTGDAFCQTSRMRTQSVAWDDILRFGFMRGDPVVPGTGLGRDLCIETGHAGQRLGLSSAAIGRAHASDGVLDGFFAHLGPASVELEMVVLKHLVESSNELARTAVESPQAALGFSKIQQLSLTRGAKLLGEADQNGSLDLDGLRLLSETRLLMRQYRQALWLCDRIEEQRPDDFWAMLCHAIALRHEGRAEDGCGILEKLSARDGPYRSILRANYEAKCEIPSG